MSQGQTTGWARNERTGAGGEKRCKSKNWDLHCVALMGCVVECGGEVVRIRLVRSTKENDTDLEC